MVPLYKKSGCRVLRITMKISKEGGELTNVSGSGTAKP